MILDRLYKLITSLKLAVTLLGIGIVLVFLGTLAQEPLGLYAAQDRFFRSFFVDGASIYAALYKLADIIAQGFGHPLAPLDGSRLLTAPRFPVFPGGYLVGILLLINLLAAHLRYYQPGRKKYAIAMIHGGIVLLLAGQLLTDTFSSESSMHIRNGGTKNYSESSSDWELAIVDTSDADADKVVAISDQRLRNSGDISHPELPFSVRVKTYYNNSSLTNDAGSGYEAVQTSAGIGTSVWWREWPHETEMNKRDQPSAIVELLAPQGSLGTWLVSAYLSRPQQFTFNGRKYLVDLRPERFYKPFSLHLVEFRHDRYIGTEIPRNFSSRVRLQRPDTGENRELVISMNKPLRYAGETFYQASYDPDNQGTILQVVRNPSALSPYCACWLVSLGLMVQFLLHFLNYLNLGARSGASVAGSPGRESASLSGIRGWLIAFAAGLIGLALVWPLVHFSHLVAIGRTLKAGGAAQLATLAILVVGFWAYIGFVAYLFFNRRKNAPGHLILLAVFWPIVHLVLGTISDFTFGDRTLLSASYVGVSGQGLITILVYFLTAVWILYFMRSRRVMTTFNR